MSVITITREIGSLSREVAESVASSLGLRFIDHEQVEHDLAGRLKVAETTVRKCMEGGASLFDYWRMDRKGFAVHAALELYDLALEGKAVIYGWVAPQLLKPVSHVLSVRVCAPLPDRVRHLLDSGRAESVATAHKDIKTNDRAHARLLRRLYHADWSDPLLYDVVLNAAQLSVDECVETISRLATGESFRETSASRAALAELRRVVEFSTAQGEPGHAQRPEDWQQAAALRERGYSTPKFREDSDLLI